MAAAQLLALVLPRPRLCGGESPTEDPPLLQAVAEGNAAAAERRLEAGASADPEALAAAVAAEDLTLLKLLLRYGADVDARDAAGATALIKVACLAPKKATTREGDAEVAAKAATRLELLHELLFYGTDVNVADANGETALHKACSRVDSAIVHMLLSYGCNPDATSTSKRTPVAMALLCDRPQNLHLLLQFGANPNASADLVHRGRTALMTAVAWNRLPHVKILLQHGVATSRRDSCGQTALELAGAAKLTDAAVLLMDHGVHVDREMRKPELRAWAELTYSARATEPWKAGLAPLPRRIFALARPWILLALRRAGFRGQVPSEDYLTPRSSEDSFGSRPSNDSLGSSFDGFSDSCHLVNGSECIQHVLPRMPVDLVPRVLGFVLGHDLRFVSLLPKRMKRKREAMESAAPRT